MMALFFQKGKGKDILQAEGLGGGGLGEGKASSLLLSEERKQKKEERLQPRGRN